MELEKNHKPLSERIAEELKEYIISHDLKAGDKIPPEKVLVTNMGVGRSTVREAVKYLVSRNILEIRHGAGTFITDKMGQFEDPLGIEFIKDKRKLTYDLIEIRLIIEPPIAALAARNATEQDIQELEELLDRVERKMKEGHDYTQLDILFHQKIAEISKNTVIPKVTPLISSAVIAITRETKRSLLDQAIQTHREIFDSIKARDSISAQEAMMLHLVYNKRYLKELDRETSE